MVVVLSKPLFQIRALMELLNLFYNLGSSACDLNKEAVIALRADYAVISASFRLSFSRFESHLSIHRCSFTEVYQILS